MDRLSKRPGSAVIFIDLYIYINILNKYGILWKCFDIVSSRGLFYRPPILTDNPIAFPSWILGGLTGLILLWLR